MMRRLQQPQRTGRLPVPFRWAGCRIRWGNRLLGGGSIGNDRDNAAATAGGAVGPAVVALVAERGARIDVRSEVEKHLEMGCVAGFAAVRSKARKWPSKSVLRWILVEFAQ